MEAAVWLYAAVLSVGALAVCIAIRSPAVGVALWAGVYPLVSDLVVPGAVEKLPASRLVTLFLLAVLLPRLGSRLVRRKLLWPCLAYGLFVLLGVASAMHSPLVADALFRTISYTEPLVWFLIGGAAVSGEAPVAKARILLRGVVLGFAGMVLVAVPEFILQSNPMLVAGISRTDYDYMLDRRLGNTGRLVSTIGQPVYAGILGVVAVAAIWYLVQTSPRFRSRLLLSLQGLAGLIFVFLTGTRAALIGLILLPVSYLVLAGRRANLIGLAAGYIVLGVIAFALPNSTLGYWRESVSIDEPSAGAANVVGRMALTLRMYNVFKEHPVLGIGPGFFQKAQSDMPGFDTEGLAGVENQYATLLAENGLLGLVAFLVFLYVLISSLRKSAVGLTRPSSVEFGPWCGALIGTLCIMAVSCSILTTTPMLIAMGLAGSVLSAGGLHQPVQTVPQAG